MRNYPEVQDISNNCIINSGLNYSDPSSRFLNYEMDRNFKEFTEYITDFICMITQTVHLEGISSYPAKAFSKAFLKALSCFITRKRLCKTIYGHLWI